LRRSFLTAAALGLTLSLATLPFLAAACGSRGGGAAAATSGRALRKPHEEMAKAFARAVLVKDYDGAYRHTSDMYQSQVGKSDFLESIARYRDRFDESAKLTFKLRTGDETIEEVRNDEVLKLFVSDEAVRAKVVEEVIIDFEPAGDAEGWTLIAWLVEESGTTKILNYLQDD